MNKQRCALKYEEKKKNIFEIFLCCLPTEVSVIIKNNSCVKMQTDYSQNTQAMVEKRKQKCMKGIIFAKLCFNFNLVESYFK